MQWRSQSEYLHVSRLQSCKNGRCDRKLRKTIQSISDEGGYLVRIGSSSGYHRRGDGEAWNISNKARICRFWNNRAHEIGTFSQRGLYLRRGERDKHCSTVAECMASAVIRVTKNEDGGVDPPGTQFVDGIV